MAKRKKKRKRGKYVAGAVGCAAIVGIIVGLRFDGLGIGDGFGFDLGSNSESVYEEDDNDSNAGQAADTPSQVVTVEGDSIYHNGAEISLEQLGTILTSYSDATWELRSERAIAAVQDDVRAMLQQHGVSFTESSD